MLRQMILLYENLRASPSHGGDGYIVLSPNSNKNLSSVRLRAPP
nr:MAG TPA: hypothetical protein [Caudoviricetes sp.]